jgi:tRNA U34 2-thiouridine synthase MnmA/TrmU
MFGVAGDERAPTRSVGRRAPSDFSSTHERRCFAQIRYNAPAQPATMTVLPDRRLHIRFDEPQFAVTPGQAVVCYDAENNQRVLGGGWIE